MTCMELYDIWKLEYGFKSKIKTQTNLFYQIKIYKKLKKIKRTQHKLKNT